MTDLLAHVLVANALVTALSWRVGAIDPRHVPVGMLGAALPDLEKVHLLIGSDAVASALGVDFSWHAFHRLGPALVVVGLATLAFESGERRPVAAALSTGVVSHFVLDGFLVRASGHSPPYLYPLSWWRPPAGGLYLSSDLAPTAVAFALAAIVWLLDRRRVRG